MNAGNLFYKPTITILGQELIVHETVIDSSQRNYYVYIPSNASPYVYLVCCWHQFQWTEPNAQYPTFKDYMAAQMMGVETRINEFAARWKGITLSELGDMFKSDGDGLPVNYLIKAFSLPREARTWLNSLERCQAIWEHGENAYQPEQETLSHSKLQWYYNGYFAYSNVEGGTYVLLNNSMELVTNGSVKFDGKEFIENLDGSWTRIAM